MTDGGSPSATGASAPAESASAAQIAAESAIGPAVRLFYQRVLRDAALSPYFVGIDIARLRAHQKAFLSAALGGPEVFTGRSLTAAHRDLAIDDAAFDAMVGHLTQALEDVGLPPDDLDTIEKRLLSYRPQVVAATAR